MENLGEVLNNNLSVAENDMITGGKMTWPKFLPNSPTGAEVCGWVPYPFIFRQVPSDFLLNFSALSYVCLGRSKKEFGILVVGMHFRTGSPKFERFVNPFCPNCTMGIHKYCINFPSDIC